MVFVIEKNLPLEGFTFWHGFPKELAILTRYGRSQESIVSIVTKCCNLFNSRKIAMQLLDTLWSDVGKKSLKFKNTERRRYGKQATATIVFTAVGRRLAARSGWKWLECIRLWSRAIEGEL
jgi:hypothetical protein